MHHIKMTSTFLFLQSIFNAPPMPLISIAHKKSCDNFNIISCIHFNVCTYYILFYNYTQYNNMYVNRNLHNIVIT